MVGPEAPLVAGLGDRLAEAGIACFGPGGAAAQIEGSKLFAKSVMDAAGVPTAGFSMCDTPAAAQLAIAEAEGNVVVKADGLAGGKGVFVCSSVAEAEAAVQACLIDRRFGAAGAQVLIEERMEGPEVSLLRALRRRACASTGRGPRPQAAAGRRPRAQHRRDGLLLARPRRAPELVDEIVATVHRPVINELARRDMPFSGCLYAGLMLTERGPRVLEFNARWGDPETQVLVPRLEGDLLDALRRSADGSLDRAVLGVSGQACVSVVIAAPGYPDAPEAGGVIEGLDRAEHLEGVTVFHAGTGERDGRVVAAGGRVLNVTALGADLASARSRAYEAVELIDLPGGQVRTDIGAAAAVGRGV